MINRLAWLYVDGAPTPDAIAGTFAMLTVGGAPLPVTSSMVAGRRHKIRRAALIVAPGGTWVGVTWAAAEAHDASTEEVLGSAGQWARDGSALVFADQAGTPIGRATFEPPGRLTMTLEVAPDAVIIYEQPPVT